MNIIGIMPSLELRVYIQIDENYDDWIEDQKEFCGVREESCWDRWDSWWVDYDQLWDRIGREVAELLGITVDCVDGVEWDDERQKVNMNINVKEHYANEHYYIAITWRDSPLH